MRKSLKGLIVASTFAAAIAVAPTVSAHETQTPQGPTMGQMSQMMETCNKMMQGGAMEKHDPAPEAPPKQQQ